MSKRAEAIAAVERIIAELRGLSSSERDRKLREAYRAAIARAEALKYWLEQAEAARPVRVGNIVRPATGG